jgi:pyruvate formate lyase activating enzyme
MKISGLQKLTLLDYPGKTAATVFLSGCNLRCPFCHNSRLVKGQDFEEIPEEDFFAYLEKRSGLLDGVCITGGEPLLREGLEDFITRIKALGYLVKLDTNGTLPDRLEAVLPLVDYVAMDIKNTPEKYPETVGLDGFDVSGVMRSVELLKKGSVDHEFRTTLVKGLHDEDSVEQIAKWLGEGEKYFLQKFVDSGEVLSDGLEPLSDEVMQKCLNRALKYVPFAQLRGM